MQGTKQKSRSGRRAVGGMQPFPSGQEKDRAERILFELEQVVRGKKRAPVDEASYTSKIVRNRAKLGKKVVEEAFELATAKKKENVVWEAADLLYFVVTCLVNRGVPLADVLGELARRRDSEKPAQRYAPSKASVPD
jgi:phosphoribosyl-ATP pyrophosphohydrolase